MKKIIMTSMLLAGTSLVAGEYFIGANLGNADMGAKISGTVTLNGTSYSAGYSDSDKDTNFNGKFGYVTEKSRYYIQTGKLYDKDGLEYKSTTINYDKFFKQTKDGFIPFVGVHIGRGEVNIVGFKETGNEYGFQAGLLKDIDNNLGFEAGLRHTFTSAKYDLNESGTYAGYNYSINGEVSSDDATAFYVGMNYKF